MKIPLSRLTSLALAACTAILAGCSVTSPIWRNTGVEGPPLANGVKTTVMHKCTYPVIQLFPGSGSGITCARAFSTGPRLIEFGEFFAKIIGSFHLAKELHPHLRAYEKEYHPKGYVRGYERHKLHLLALEPIVIVGTPAGPYASGCLISDSFRCFNIGSPETMVTTMHFGEHPPVVEGAFLLLPESGAPSTTLPHASPGFELELDQGSVKLVQRGDFWRLEPYQPHSSNPQ